MGARGLALSLASGFVCVAAAWGADRTAAQILRDLDAVKVPKPDSASTENAARRDQEIRAREAAFRRARLIGELFKAAPDHARVPALLEERWKTLSEHPENGRYAELLQELDRVVARPPSNKLKIEASYLRARLRLKPISTKKEPDVSGVGEFVKLAPKDPRTGDLLSSAVVVARDLKIRKALLAQLALAVPDSDLPGMLEEDHDPKTSIGKPFHLEFTNAITGTTVAMRHLKGKVVVVVFWATSSDACVTGMTQWKELATKYHSQGVEFIGVSLDQAESEGESGLESLKKFVKEKNVNWPQYYPGSGLDSSFAKSWSITAIPRVFLVDADGKLVSTDAGAELDKGIADVLAGKKPGVGATAPQQQVPSWPFRGDLRSAVWAGSGDPRPTARPASGVFEPCSPPRAEDQRHDLGAGRQPLLEHAPHGARHERAVGLVDSANRHAAMAGLDHDCHALGIKLDHQQVGQLLGEPLLHLRALGQHVHNPRNLR